MTSAGPAPATEVVLLTGMSGSGKSVALHALEDAGYFCVDNLPPELLAMFVMLERRQEHRKMAVAVDVRSADSLHLLPKAIQAIEAEPDTRVISIYLDTNTPTLVRRYSETRRPHPLKEAADLRQAIDHERNHLSALRDKSVVIDTSDLRPATLRRWVLNLVASPSAEIQLVFTSFAFKRGVPMSADFLYDLRCLPNPYYDPVLRPLTGRDAPVAQYLRDQAEVNQLLDDIEGFLRRWIPQFQNLDQRSYVTVAMGCTGGQHRSVYAVETLSQRFAADYRVHVRHRELDN